MINDRLKRVQVGRTDDVLDTTSNVWYLFIKEGGSWDAGQTNDDDFFKLLTSDSTKLIFVVWHGQYRTNLFLMDKKKTIKRLKPFFLKKKK